MSDGVAAAFPPPPSSASARQRLSVTLIVKNEAEDLPACLASVAWADEIVVVDSGSTDDTVDIARRHGARVLVTPDWPGFGAQKNRALALASHPWVLSLDADERVTPALRAAIERCLLAPKHAAYSLPRRSYFCGVAVRHSGWWPDRVVRLFNTAHARFNDALVHERVEVAGSIGRLEEPLLHYTYRDVSEFHRKLVDYSDAGARMLLARGRRPGMASALLHGAWAFVRTYILRQGWRDGRVGLLIALGNAESSFYKYAKAAMASMVSHESTCDSPAASCSHASAAPLITTPPLLRAADISEQLGGPSKSPEHQNTTS